MFWRRETNREEGLHVNRLTKKKASFVLWNCQENVFLAEHCARRILSPGARRDSHPTQQLEAFWGSWSPSGRAGKWRWERAQALRRRERSKFRSSENHRLRGWHCGVFSSRLREEMSNRRVHDWKAKDTTLAADRWCAWADRRRRRPLRLRRVGKQALRRWRWGLWQWG